MRLCLGAGRMEAILNHPDEMDGLEVLMDSVDRYEFCPSYIRVRLMNLVALVSRSKVDSSFA